ncbi:MAG: T9SS type A sorting domain-containing protein [Bacteroidales bacterium]|nr:T9SS type A sorting domain-containing protein [Bacteroidales bacterium]
MKRIIVFNFFLLSTILVLAQNPPDTLWTRTFGGIENESTYSIQLTSDNGYIFTGYTNSFSAGENDFWLVKTDENGIEEWNHAYGGINGEVAKSVQQTSDDGYVMAGITWSFGAGEGDFWIVKTDSLGNEEWNRTFGGPLGDQAESIQQTNDGGYIVTGVYEVIGNPPIKLALVKLDQNGNLEWEQTFGNSGFNVGYSVLQSEDDGFIVGGFKSTPDHDFWLLKTDGNGNLEWEHTYDLGVDQVKEIRKTSDNGYILIGTTHAFSGGEYDFWLVKTDSLGNEEWNHAYGGNEYEFAVSVIQDCDNGYLLTGATEALHPDMYDLWLIKTDELGDIEWEIIFSDDDRYIGASSMQTTSDGNYIIAGHVGTNEPGSLDALILKVGYNTAIEDHIIFESQKSSLNNFPNPFNPETTISFSIPNYSNIELSIYNIKGQKIKTLAHEHYSKGEYSVIWDGEDASGEKVGSGVYFYKLNVNGKTETVKKCLLLE